MSLSDILSVNLFLVGIGILAYGMKCQYLLPGLVLVALHCFPEMISSLRVGIIGPHLVAACKNS